MDFKQDKTQEQSSFRSVVRSWLDRHAPRDLSFPRDGSPLPVETQDKIKEFRRKLGAQGWLAPTWPRAYGGGGLGPAQATTIPSELSSQLSSPEDGPALNQNVGRSLR